MKQDGNSITAYTWAKTRTAEAFNDHKSIEETMEWIIEIFKSQSEDDHTNEQLHSYFCTVNVQFQRYVQFTMFFRYRRHRDVDDIVSISCQHRYLVIPRLHLRHRDVDDIVSISCQHRYPVIGGLPYLVYIVHIVDIAMLTISYRHRVDIGTLSYLY